jgi:hypothetical protein
MGVEPATNSSAGALQGRPGPLGSLLNALRIASVVTYSGGNVRQFRHLRFSGILLAMSGVASVFLVAELGAGDVADVIALRVVAYACWLYGALGLWALLSPEALENSGRALLKMRGQSHLPFRSQSLGIARHLSVGMCLSGIPGVVTAAALSPSLESLVHRLGLVAVCVVYLLSLSLVLGAIGGLSVRSAPKSPRRLALLLIVAPFFVSLFADDVPSIPGFYSWLLGEMIAWGGAIS